MMRIGNSLGSDRDINAAEKASYELGQMIRNLAVRALTFERTAIELAAGNQEALDGIRALAARARLPGD
jgi:hypothetical protein